MMEKRFFSRMALLWPCFVFSPILAHAAHPLITDDSGTQGTGGFLLELNGEYARHEDSEVTAKETEAAASLTYGPAETVDVVLGVPYLWAEEDSDGQEVSEQGLGDVSIDVKWMFFEKDDLALALKPGITLPTGDEDEGLGAGEITYSAFFIASKECDPFAFHLNMGYLRNENDFDERRDLWHVSLATEYALAESWRLVANIGQERNPDKESEVNPAFILGGVICSITEDFDVDLGVKAGLNDVEADYALLAGIALRF